MLAYIPYMDPMGIKTTILRGHGLLKNTAAGSAVPRALAAASRRGLISQPAGATLGKRCANVGNMLEECGKTQTYVGKYLGKPRETHV